MSDIQKEGEPAVTYAGILDCQVCVPKDWTDAQALEFAEKTFPCGTRNGWFIRVDEELLAGMPYRMQCSEHESHIHIMLDA